MKTQSLPGNPDYQTHCIETEPWPDRKICKLRFYLYICNAYSLMDFTISQSKRLFAQSYWAFFMPITIGGCLLRKLLIALRGDSPDCKQRKMAAAFSYAYLSNF